MKLCLKNEDEIFIKDRRIYVIIDHVEYSFEKSEIEAVMIITTDYGPFYDDMCLAIRINNETAVFLMSEHPLYQKFLFEELKIILDIDYGEVINAASCVENSIFFLYKKDQV